MNRSKFQSKASQLARALLERGEMKRRHIGAMAIHAGARFILLNVQNRPCARQETEENSGHTDRAAPCR